MANSKYPCSRDVSPAKALRLARDVWSVVHGFDPWFVVSEDIGPEVAQEVLDVLTRLMQEAEDAE